MTFSSSNVNARVKSITYNRRTHNEARPSKTDVTFTVENLSKRDIKLGCIAGNYENNPPSKVESFEAQIVIFKHHISITTGYQSILECHRAKVLCTFEKILAKCDGSTGKILEENPESIKSGDSALVKLQLSRPFCVEKFNDYPALGRVIFIQKGNKEVIGAGIVKSI